MVSLFQFFIQLDETGAIAHCKREQHQDHGGHWSPHTLSFHVIVHNIINYTVCPSPFHFIHHIIYQHNDRSKHQIIAGSPTDIQIGRLRNLSYFGLLASDASPILVCQIGWRVILRVWNGPAVQNYFQYPHWRNVRFYIRVTDMRMWSCMT